MVNLSDNPRKSYQIMFDTNKTRNMGITILLIINRTRKGKGTIHGYKRDLTG